MSRRAASIQRRLLVTLLGAVALVGGLAAFMTWRAVHHEVDELLDAHLTQGAALLVVQQSGLDAEPDGDEHDDDAHRTLDAPTLHRHAPRAVFQVFHHGRLTLRSADAPVAPLLALDAVDARLRDAARHGSDDAHAEPGGHGAGVFADVTDAQGQGWRVFAARGAEADVRVIVGERSDARHAIVGKALTSALAPFAVAAPLVALLAVAAVRRALKPLRVLGTTLAQRHANATAPVQLPDAPAEVVPLVDALNGLLARIDAMLQSERRFTADAAHELRTPIAAIRMQAQVALGAADDEAARRHALVATVEGCDRARRVVDQLLTLSRLEAGSQVAFTSVDLAALARQVVADAAPRALDRGQTLSVDVVSTVAGATTAPPTVRGDATLIAVLLRNLVDNAVRYAGDGATIAVEVGDPATSGAALVTVTDDGPGVPPDRLPRLGERFHRGLGHDASGSGLGLSIVKRIAQVHGWAVDVGRGDRGGLRVAVRVEGGRRG